ncbi:MAG: helix-turn-helix transcriptional regulator [Rhizomicrobium sp.]
MSWTKQTYLEPGAYLAHAVRGRTAGPFSLGYWTDDGSEAKGRHGHAAAHFMLVTSGCYETAAQAGSASHLLIYNPPDTWHDDRFHGGGAFFTITAGEGAPEGCARLVPEGRMTMRRALRELAEWSADSAPIAEALCWELVGIAAGDSVDRASPAWLGEACDYLRDNAAAAVDLRALSRALGVHPVHLTRTFRAFLRCTPGDYLRGHRLDRAAALLTEGSRSLAEIAAASGFSDQSHLNRHFRRAYGATPGQYRALTRAN